MLTKCNLNNLFQSFKYYKLRSQQRCQCCDFYEAKYPWYNIMLCGYCIEFWSNPRHSVRNIAEMINVYNFIFSNMVRNGTAVNAVHISLHLNIKVPMLLVKVNFCCNCAQKHERSPKDDSDLTLSSKHDLLRFIQQYWIDITFVISLECILLC